MTVLFKLFGNFDWPPAPDINDVKDRLQGSVEIGFADKNGKAATGSVAGVHRVLMTVARDAPAHPSLNAGPVEAAFAAALGVSLGGSNSYAGVVEDRGRLGDGPAVTVDDLGSAVRLERRIGLIALGVIVAARRAAARRVVSRRRTRRAR